MAMTTTHKQIASRYVSALFDLAAESKKLDKTADELEILATLFVESADFKRLCTDPTLSRETQTSGIEAILKKAKPTPLITQFIQTLVSNRRLAILPTIAEDFRTCLRAQNGQVVADITTATKLKKAEETKLIKLLGKYTGKQVILRVTQDTSILGGLHIMVDGTMIDASTQGRLTRLKDNLYHGIRQIV